MNYIFILLFIVLSAVLVGVGLIAASLVAPNNPGAVKNSPYECGEKPVGPAWIRFNVGYYLFGLLFLVFDVEAAFLYPWALVFREVGFPALIEGGVFILVLVIALAYAWRKGVLEWV